LNFGDVGFEKDLDLGSTAFGFEEIGDVRCGIVAEELAQAFFVVGNAMLFYEGEEIRGGESGQGGFGEMGIRREEIFWRGVDVGEVAAATAGNKDFFADAVDVLEYSDTAAAFAGFGGAEKAGGACADDQDVEGAWQKDLTVFLLVSV
jgi:hypothetical protein